MWNLELKVGAAAAVNVATTFNYEPMGPLTGFTYGNGLVRTKSYDLDRRLTNIAVTGASGIQSLGYAYNANDAITTLTNGSDLITAMLNRSRQALVPNLVLGPASHPTGACGWELLVDRDETRATSESIYLEVRR